MGLSQPMLSYVAYLAVNFLGTLTYHIAVRYGRSTDASKMLKILTFECLGRKKIFGGCSPVQTFIYAQSHIPSRSTLTLLHAEVKSVQTLPPTHCDPLDPQLRRRTLSPAVHRLRENATKLDCAEEQVTGSGDWSAVDASHSLVGEIFKIVPDTPACHLSHCDFSHFPIEVGVVS